MDFSDKYRSAGKIIVFRVGEDVLVTSPIKNRRDYLLFNKVPLSLMTHPDTKHFQMVISQGFVLASYTSPSPPTFITNNYYYIRKWTINIPITNSPRYSLKKSHLIYLKNTRVAKTRFTPRIGIITI